MHISFHTEDQMFSKTNLKGICFVQRGAAAWSEELCADFPLGFVACKVQRGAVITTVTWQFSALNGPVEGRVKHNCV